VVSFVFILIKGIVPRDFYFHFLLSNCSTWDPDSKVEWILLLKNFALGYLSFKFLSGVGQNGEVFVCCGIQRKRFIFWCRIQWQRFSSGVGYNTEKFQDVKEFSSVVSHKAKVFFHCIPHWNNFSSVVSHTAKESSAMYPSTRKVLFLCGIQ
jgi:hypothetical protein